MISTLKIYEVDVILFLAIVRALAPLERTLLTVESGIRDCLPDRYGSLWMSFPNRLSLKVGKMQMEVILPRTTALPEFQDSSALGIAWSMLIKT